LPRPPWTARRKALTGTQKVPLTFGSSGFVFDLPGTYRIKAVYNDGHLAAVSNVATLRVGAPMSREEDRLAAEWFTNAVAHKAEGDKTTNLAYRALVEQRADLHVAAGRPAQARKELSSLAAALSRRGANPNVVAGVKAEAESLGK
jgi:hypothetical protein